MSSTPPDIRQGTAGDLESLRRLWHELYEHQARHGMRIGVTDDGFQRWSDSLVRLLGRFACLFIAQEENGPVGFLAARVRTPTPPFSADPVGFISEVYVVASRRESGIGRRLLEAARRWMAEAGINRLELQVLSSNTSARVAYERLGWREELIQMVSETNPGSL